nr:hypothetical protein [Sphaerisporangium cinnabarinum]
MTATITELGAYDPKNPVERAVARALRRAGQPVTRAAVREIVILTARSLREEQQAAGEA